MGIMGFLRERMGLILVFFIGFALFAFIAGEVIHYGGSFFRGDATEMGDVNGEKIAYADFSKSVDQNAANFKQQSGQATLSPQIMGYVQQNTWDQLIRQMIIKKEIDRVGITISDMEAQEMISGKNPSPQIVQAFGNPQTGQLDRVKLNNFLMNIKTAKADDPTRMRWSEFVLQLIDAKKAEKYMTLVGNGLFVNSLDVKDDYENKNKLVNLKYVTLSYASIPDNQVAVSDDDYNEYYNDHKSEFKNQQELRSFDFVTFNAAPSKDDSALVKADVAKLIPDFKASTNDSLFVQINSETKDPVVYKTKAKIDPKLDTPMFNAPNGFIYGPYLSNGSYKIAKLVDSRIGPDSVKARHILLSPTAEGGLDKAMKKADSLKKLIEGGKSFADLAKMYSTDKGSAVKGGDLGTFGRGAMIPVFEDAAFNGKKGDLKIVNSQYGVHLIEIEDQKGSSKVVKIAVVDKPLSASSKTQSAAYSKAQAFLGNVNSDNFDKIAAQSALPVNQATDINGIASSFATVTDGRDVVRWAYKAKAGDISDQVFTVGNQYLVALLTSIKPQGTLPLEAVKKQIQQAVVNHVKGKQLMDKMQAALSGSSNIDLVAQKIKGKAVVAQNVVFANPVVPGIGLEYKVIGSAFGSQPNKLSKAIEGTLGVYAYQVDGFIKPAPLGNAVKEKEQLGQAILQRAEQQGLDALKDKANVKDYRSKFL